jgi:hypothetical protein
VPTGLNYTSYVQQIATMAVVQTTDPAFVTILPEMIDYAELRIIRDTDLLATVARDSSTTLTVGNRTVSFPSFVTVQQINVITPSTTTNPDNGTRNALIPVSKEFMDAVYVSNSVQSVPVYFAPVSQAYTSPTPYTNTFLVGPAPDAAYTIEVVGTQRPATLSATNTTTFISVNMPDLFIMASMIYISAYQRNFGRQSDDPAMAMSYEGQYQLLLKSAVVEEARKKFASSGWTSMQPAAVASPSRG